VQNFNFCFLQAADIGNNTAYQNFVSKIFGMVKGKCLICAQFEEFPMGKIAKKAV